MCLYMCTVYVCVRLYSVCTRYVYNVCMVSMHHTCVDGVYGICVCMMCAYTLQGTHAKFRKRPSWCQFFPSMWVLRIELGFLGKGFTFRAAFLWPSLCRDSDLCPGEGITSFLIFFVILVKSDRHIPGGKDGIILADILLLPNGMFFSVSLVLPVLCQH